MLIDNQLFDQEWFAELPLRQRYLYVYLLTKCTKVGIFEINLRKMTYDMNDGSPVTRDDIFKPFGDRIIPVGDNKGIFVDYIAFNWQREKPLDPVGNPLHRGLLNELSRHGLSFEWVSEHGHRPLKIKGGSAPVPAPVAEVVKPKPTHDAFDVDAKFEEFWSAYPRKTGKKPALGKFSLAMSKTTKKDECFKAMMAGLEKWKASPQWQRDNGQYIPYPTTWLNQERWNDEVEVGTGGSVVQSESVASDEYKRKQNEFCKKLGLPLAYPELGGE